MIRHMIKIMLGSIPHQKLFLFIIYLLEDEQELSLGMLICLRRIYNFWLFHANILQLSHILATFYMISWTNLLIQCQFLFLHVFCIAEYPYQTKSKCNRILRRIILEYMWFLGVGITANGGPHIPQDTRVRHRPLARGGGLWALWAPVCVDSTSQNHINSKIILC